MLKNKDLNLLQSPLTILKISIIHFPPNTPQRGSLDNLLLHEISQIARNVGFVISTCCRAASIHFSYPFNLI
jgi:hypothetical protein